MNSEFMKKMLKAELIRYEAIKGILPDRIKTHVDTLESEAVSVIKEFALEMIKDNMSNKACADDSSDANNDAKVKKEAKKVNVDFS